LAAATEPLGRQQQAFEAAVADVLERIAAGEVYQVNLTADALWPAPVVPAPLRLAAAVLAAQPIPFGLCWHDKDFTVVSGSMERFVSVRDGQIAARPIKGTAPRFADPAQDLASRDTLLASHKERAENLMIVDMMRNDLQRVCVRGTVQVQELLAAVPYKTLWHLESEIVGQLQDPMDLVQLLCQTLPPASVTGCPKVQALQVIAHHEPTWRGPYCGVLGVALPDGRQDWSVAIRTLVFANERTRLQVGAGLVADSQPALEWQELLHKATAGERALQSALQACSAGRS
jgi:para-aminobenzoate synthetase component 1